MNLTPVYIGPAVRKRPSRPVTGGFGERYGETFYKIANFDRMAPFFMSIVSDSDHWMFISSSGALTAGRKNPEHALFPYYTDDKIHDSKDLTGSKTLVLAGLGEKTYLWEPFSDRYEGVYDIERNLYKSIYGNKILFEEINHDVCLTFYYAWSNSEQFGLIKRSGIHNQNSSPVDLRILDGIQNLLPFGVDRGMQTDRSTLVDAYKKNELLPDTGLGIFTLSSIPVDKPEPSEALKATTVWSSGIERPTYLVSARQLDRFRKGRTVELEQDVRAERGAYFVHAPLKLACDEARDWYIVAEVDQGPSEIAALSVMLAEESAVVREKIETDINQGTQRLKRIVAQADGLQSGRDRLNTTRHFANVLFNVMRGGVFVNNNDVEKADLSSYLLHHNRSTAKQHKDFLESLPDRLSVVSLIDLVAREGDSQLVRLCYEYLPLTFSRRHGDPSRPWNYFSIETRKEDGSKNLYYQGNWRDIFQNWEALSLSFPAFLPGIIGKFVNASTIDGYNPYRITRDGIDWEVLDPSDPWSFIGYWGDHQIVYLLKLLEICRDYFPGTLEGYLVDDLFAYANVPYRIKPYGDLLQNPHDTIVFDGEEATRTEQRVREIGADGKLIWDKTGRVYLVNLTEKILVSVLAKLTNFIPEAGIWMNTQRPEWNDANNALVGNGVSMVTLYYLRRFLQFCHDLFDSMPVQEISISEEVAEYQEGIYETLRQYRRLLDGPISDIDRKKVLDTLGDTGSVYRSRVYEDGLSERKKQVETTGIMAFCELALEYIDHTIRANRREDGLFHAYNLMSVEGEAVSVHYLYEMLEGQVAVLSSGLLTAGESLEVLSALRTSNMYRADQDSYLLYPDRSLPRFVEKNTISPERVSESSLIKKLLSAGDRRLIQKDEQGSFHFNGLFRNANDVRAALNWLSDHGYEEEIARDRAFILDLFEELFDHRSYTGRSGTFFGYEGLGSIYWHMVSKLLLAIKEILFRARGEGAGSETIEELVECYYNVRAGVGPHKAPDVYGAFPIDPYSHTPGNAGAQQPGLTGQVKEDILSRWGELGVCVDSGRLRFRPILLQKNEFLTQEASFSYFDVHGNERTIQLDAGQLAFTYCQIPVVYHIARTEKTVITHNNDTVQEIAGLEMDMENSSGIFLRNEAIVRIDVFLTPGL